MSKSCRSCCESRIVSLLEALPIPTAVLVEDKNQKGRGLVLFGSMSDSIWSSSLPMVFGYTAPEPESVQAQEHKNCALCHFLGFRA